MLKKQIQTVSRIAINLQIWIDRSVAEEYFASSSQPFFCYVRLLCEKVNSYLRSVLDRLEKKDFDARTERLWENDLLTIKEFLASIHKLIKDATGATILRIPYPLVAFINRLVKNIPGVTQNTQVLIMSTGQYSFYHDPITDIRTIEAEHIFPSFPRHLGFICFPFLESHNFLTNCTLFHELGHYIFFLLGVKDKIRREFSTLLNLEGTSDPEVEAIRKSVVNGSDMYGPNRLKRKGWSLIDFWASEMFCDLLACRIIGPAFFYNFWLLQHSFPLRRINRFDWRHPAFIYRLSKMYVLLCDEGWSDTVKVHTPLIYKWLKEHCGIESKESVSYELAPEVSEYLENALFCRWIVKRLNNVVVPYLSSCAKEITKNVKASKEDFYKNHESITNYLEHFIVPSVLIHNDETRTIPSEATLLTSASIFYLNLIEKWDNILEDAKKLKDLERHAFYHKKLNDFIMKAMTDIVILGHKNGRNW